MFFDSVDDIESIAGKTGTSVFVLPKNIDVEIKGALILGPEDKSLITIEQVRNVISKVNIKQLRDMFVLVRPADLMSEPSANAFLKALEEPKENVHFVLITDSPSKILPTIMSRSALYFWRNSDSLSNEISASEKDKDLAKKLLVAKSAELVDLAEEISKNKEGARAYAMNILGIAIEMIYKSYFLTEKEIFLRKLPKFLNAYDGIARNGHVRLQIVANLC